MTHPGNYAVCVIGLGAMGMGAARSCLRAGLTTYGADLNPQALAALQQAGAKQTSSSACDFAAELDAVLLLVVNAAQVKQLLFGEQGLAPKLKPGTAVMVCSTISADDAKQRPHPDRHLRQPAENRRRAGRRADRDAGSGRSEPAETGRAHRAVLRRRR